MSRREWTHEEDSLLLRLYPDRSMTELLQVFPDRTPGGIYSRSAAIGARKITRSEPSDIAVKGRKITSTGYRADRGGLTMHRLR